MLQHGKNGQNLDFTSLTFWFLTPSRTAEQSEGNKTVGVDPTVITART